MSTRFEKLVALLKELFQLDQPDLDFGIYRIMHAKNGEITQFLEEDLLPQVKKALAAYQSADEAALENELQQAIEHAKDLGVDPETTLKVKQLRARLSDEAVDLEALEADVYDHLYRFFRRYYHEGDFISKRVYKNGVYAIPYEGEEVKLYWANHDQYYIKTSEYLRDYAFRLRPENEKKPMRVHFRLVDAAESAHNNVKESNQRVFVLAAEDFIALEDAPEGIELVIRFEYRPATLDDWPEDQRESRKKPPVQKDVLTVAEERILAAGDEAFAPWLRELSKHYVESKGEQADYNRLRAHLNRYAARNTFDYFIHKDLGGFLRRELDFYIKNEVMHLDDIESESAPRVEQYLSKIKVIRNIAHKIIHFMAQLEDFQKKLWLKKKFVTETSWCVRVGIIPEAFYPEIFANDAQHEEWVHLHAIDELKNGESTLFDTGPPDYSKPLTPEFLKAHPTLMIDTRHFGVDFTARLLETIGDIEEQTGGLLFHSENLQALNLMQARYREQLKCVYIDPPYNTGNDEFIYKDNYQHSSWLSMLADRVMLSRSFMSAQGAFFCHIDDNELFRLKVLLDDIFRPLRFLCNFSWIKRYGPPPDTKDIGYVHENIMAYKAGEDFQRSLLPVSEHQVGRYKNPDNDPRGPWKPMDYTCRYTADERPNLYYTIRNSHTGEEVWPKKSRVWAFSKEETQRNIAENRLWWGRKGTNRVPAYKNFLSEIQQGMMPTTVLHYEVVGHTDEAAKELRVLIPGLKATPKPTRLARHLAMLSMDACSTIIDFFAGTGTTGHATLNLNREDGGRRKFILVEMGDYFDTVMLPRMKKVTFTPEWKDGKPKRMATEEEAERSPYIFKVVRLESYEDTLNNLELKRTQAQEDLFKRPEAQGADGFREQYILRYMLDVETRGSQSLLNIAAFTDPTQYRLKVKVPGSDESREVCVDLLETFNWLIGLIVHHISAPRRFTAKFKRAEDPDLPKDAPRRLMLDGRLEEAPEGVWWFRTVEGETRDGRKTLVIWRNRSGGEDSEGVEQDNLVLDMWFERQGYSSKDSEFDLIYVNGTNNLENLKAPENTWKVRLIEEDFHRLMFRMEGM